MNDLKRRFFITITLIILLIASLIIFSVKHETKIKNNSDQLAEIFYLNPITKNLEPEKRVLSSTDTGAKVNEILNILLDTGALSQNLKSPISDKIGIDSTSVSGKTATVYFSNDYNILSDADKIYLKASVTLSLTSIPEIESVIFYVGDSKVPIRAQEVVQNGQVVQNYRFDRNYVYLNPNIDPQNSILLNLTLYFPDVDLELLHQEQRSNVFANPNTIKEQYIVEELIKGTTTTGYTSLIPKSTKVISVETDNRICYVNLSSDFVNKQIDDLIQNRLSVYQIVNSLTLLPDVDAVQILIDSKKVKGFKNFDLSDVLSSDASLNEGVLNK